MKLQAPPMKRVELVLATTDAIDADLEGPEALARVLRAEVSPEWPPEHHDADALHWLKGLAKDPGSRGWGMFYVVVEGAVVGTCGYHGPPRDGVVEVGYSVVPAHRRRGIATDATRQLIETAFNRGVHTIRASTLPHLEPSIGVLRKLGFEPAPPAKAGVVTYELRRSDG